MWVWFAGAAALAYWLLAQKSATAASASGQSWTDYESFMNKPSQPLPVPVILPEGVSGGSH
jgi:hypothetical protein